MAMTAACAAFANAGMRPQPQLIRRVETANGEVFSAQPRAQRAVSETTAFLMTSMLTDVLNGGTGWQARRFGFTRPAAGKTGTTNRYRDAWFIGYAPRLATGVWIECDYPRTIAERGYAATVAVPLWGRFMTIATRNEKLTPFQRPGSVTSVAICRISGKRATEACRHDFVFDSAGYPSERSNACQQWLRSRHGTGQVLRRPFRSCVTWPAVAAPPVPQLPALTPLSSGRVIGVSTLRAGLSFGSRKCIPETNIAATMRLVTANASG